VFNFHGVGSLASDVIEPRELQIKISLAEENILEGIRNSVTKSIEIVEEVARVLGDLITLRFESAKNRILKSLAMYASCREAVKAIHLHFAQTSAVLLHNLHYLNLLNAFNQMLQNIHKMLLHLLSIGKRELSSNEKTLLSVQKFVALLNMYMKTVEGFLNAYLSRSQKSEELLSQMSRIAIDLEDYINDFASDDAYSMLPVLIVLDMEALAHSVTNLYEAILCLYQAKKS